MSNSYTCTINLKTLRKYIVTIKVLNIIFCRQIQLKVSHVNILQYSIPDVYVLEHNYIVNHTTGYPSFLIANNSRSCNLILRFLMNKKIKYPAKMNCIPDNR